MFELVPDVIVAFTLCIFLVKCNDVHDSLRILFLLLFGDAILLKRPLPLFWKALNGALKKNGCQGKCNVNSNEYIQMNKVELDDI